MIFAQLSVNHEFASDCCSNMSKFTWYKFIYVCMLGFELLLFEKFEWNCENKSFWWKMSLMLNLSWNDVINSLTNNKVLKTNLGQRGSKLGLLWRIGVSSQEEPRNLGSLPGATR